MCEVNEIGRYELGSFLLESGLRNGITKASFNSSGIIPVVMELSQSILSGRSSSSQHSLNIIAGIPSGPQDDELGSFLMAFLISFSDIIILSRVKILLLLFSESSLQMCTLYLVQSIHSLKNSLGFLTICFWDGLLNMLSYCFFSSSSGFSSESKGPIFIFLFLFSLYMHIGCFYLSWPFQRCHLPCLFSKLCNFVQA